MKRLSRTGIINGDRLLSALNRELDNKHKLSWLELEDWFVNSLSCHDAKEVVYFDESDEECEVRVERHDIELNQFHTKSRNPEFIYELCFTQFANGDYAFSYDNFDIMVDRMLKSGNK